MKQYDIYINMKADAGNELLILICVSPIVKRKSTFKYRY